MHTTAKKVLGAFAIAATATLATASAASAQAVNVYTSREPSLVLPLFDEFTFQTGIAVNTLFVSQGLAERLAAEGTATPADIVLVADYGELITVVNRGLTQPIVSEIVNAAVPPALRDPAGHWYALSLRTRVIYASVDRVPETALTYEDLAKPEWNGRVCIRSGQHPYNTFLFAAYIAKHGEEATEAYLRGLRSNLARTAGGGDRDGARDIMAGICDVAIGNSYYVGLMRSGAGGDAQMLWGNAIKVIFPTFADGLGTHVNISGVAVTANAPNPANAIAMIEFMVSEVAQQIYAGINYEYPVRAGVAVDPIIAALGTLTVDPTPLVDIFTHREAASRLVDAVGFNN